MNAFETVNQLLRLMEFQTISVPPPEGNEKMEKVLKEAKEAVKKICKEYGIEPIAL